MQQTAIDANQTATNRLVRRGAELHAPQSRMLVPKSAILLVEDLTDASPIAQFMRSAQR